MITQQLFVTETYIRENTPIINNVDTKLLNSVYEAQDMFIQPILGTSFYNQLLDSYSAQTLTADEITLVRFIQPVVIYRGLELMLPFMAYQLANKGPQTQNGDNTNNVATAEVSYLKNEVKNRAEFYETRLNQYLCKHGNLYSGYTTQSEDMLPNHQASAFDSGIATYDGNCNLPFNNCRLYSIYR